MNIPSPANPSVLFIVMVIVPNPLATHCFVAFEDSILMVKAKTKELPNPQTKTPAKKFNPFAIDT
ncbi:MAG: hypothetical protein Q8N05_20550 [Bacteroidota bacterium]|nr:hypothetical protein [Bacteroidota bacterium]